MLGRIAVEPSWSTNARVPLVMMLPPVHPTTVPSSAMSVALLFGPFMTPRLLNPNLGDHRNAWNGFTGSPLLPIDLNPQTSLLLLIAAAPLQPVGGFNGGSSVHMPL